MDKGISIRIILCIAVIGLLTSPALAQLKDWGDISRQELQMNVYSADSSAAAVILFDKAEIDFNHRLEYVMNRHVRIKILQEEGYSWATVELNYNDELDQSISRIRAHTFNIDNNNKIRKSKLDGDSIFEEEISDEHWKTKFTMPAVQPGSVVEFKYQMKIGSPHLLPDWEFQKSIPVAWSEYNVEIPEWFFYNKVFVGEHELFINETEFFTRKLDFTVKTRTGQYRTKTNFENRSIEVEGNKYRWVMRDLPAIKDMPYMTSVNDYRAKLWIQLTELRVPGRRHEYFLKTWQDVADELMDHDQFGKRFRSKSGIRKLAKTLIKGADTDLKKLQSIYSFMINDMVWDKSYTIFAEHNIQDVLITKEGSGAELNFLMIQLLQEAGLKAEPMLLSTRSHGQVFDYFAIANQFNHVISRVSVDGETYFLDATSDNDFIDLLPVNDLQNKGLVLGNSVADWIPIELKAETNEQVIINAELNEEGTLKGKFMLVSKGYDASENYDVLKKSGSVKFLENSSFSDFNNISIDSTLHENDKQEGKSKFNFSAYFNNLSRSDTQHSDDFLYFNPMFFLKIDENPFKQPERVIPVSYPYTFSKKYLIQISCPEGYTIDEVPGTIHITVPGGALKLKRIVEVSGNRISIMSDFSITSRGFTKEGYKYLQDFYDQSIKIHNDQIVLKAKSPGVENESK